MPIYEYSCANCHHQFDVLQKISDDPIKICPQCQYNSVTKLVSAAGFQLKGTGWYVTDFKNPAKANNEKTDPAKVNSSTETNAASPKIAQESKQSSQNTPSQKTTKTGE